MSSIVSKYLHLTLVSVLLIGLTFLYACDERDHKSYQGYIEGDLNYLASPYSGILIKLYVDKGDTVKPGDPIYQLDPQPQLSRLQQATYTLQQAQSELQNLQKGQRKTVLQSIQAQIKQAEAELSLAKKNVVRYRKLYLQHAIEELQYDEAKRNLQQAQNRVKEFKANLAEASRASRIDLIKAQQDKAKSLQASVKDLEWQLAQKKKVSPAAGRIFDRFYLPGEFIAEGQPIVSLLTTDNMDVVFFIPEPVLSQIKINQQIHFTCDSCNTRYTATIYFISPNAEYTPPVIFSRERREKLVYRIEAKLSPEIAKQFNAGQPVDVYLGSNDVH